MDDKVQNVLDVYASATDDDKSNSTWYDAAHTFCVGLAERYDVSLELAASVVAILSPRLEWSLNLRYADQYLRTGDCPTFFSVKAKLARLVDGESLDDVVKGGPKVKAFFSNIVDPQGSTAVTIDRHAYDAANGLSAACDQDRKPLERKGAYQAAEDVYRQAADQIGLRPCQLQAIVWCAWKRTKAYADARHAQYNSKGTILATAAA